MSIGMTEPLVSFICAVYNKGDVLAETLGFLQAQRGIAPEALEFVFVDDCSTDDSLAVLEDAKKADPRVLVFTSAVNSGPAIAFNRAAEQARGRYLIAVDADDRVPANAARFLLDCAEKFSVPLVFGRSRRAMTSPDIPMQARIETSSDALAFCARRKIVRMGFLVAREVWRRAGGADEAVFIQDQSLPLRLARAAHHVAYIDAFVYHLRPAGADNLSANRAQQHHDRFLAVLPFLTLPDISAKARAALVSQLVSSLWKIDRDRGVRLPFLCASGRVYLRHRLFGIEPSAAYIGQARERLKTLAGIRRPEDR